MSDSAHPLPPTDEHVLASTRGWLEHSVIGLNLCPFARAPYLKQRVRLRVSHASNDDQLVADLAEELGLLAAADADEIETTLLIHPDVCQDFLDFNDFMGIAEATVEALGLTGQLQVASFHPEFEFGDADEGAVENCTNRSPYPTLHLLREASIERAVDSVADPDAIFERNIAVLRELGWEGWERKRAQWLAPAAPTDPATDS